MVKILGKETVKSKGFSKEREIKTLLVTCVVMFYGFNKQKPITLLLIPWPVISFGFIELA